jgi:hypothetical protein
MMVNAEDVDRGTLGHMVPRAYAAVRAQVAGVPPEFQDEIDVAHFTTGIPKSWLAAVCEQTGWDPFYDVRNNDQYLNPRRFGIAGIWASINELPAYGRSDPGCPWGPGPKGYQTAGWFPLMDPHCSCGFPGGTGGTYDGITYPGIDPLRPVAANIQRAAEILKSCRLLINTRCGEDNSLIFLKWQLGCTWDNVDPITGNIDCETIPPNLPQAVKDQVGTLVATQALYAEIFSEPPINAQPIAVSLSANRTLVGPGGSVTFQANVQGGSGGNSFEWTFGDGSPVETTANPTVSHIYELVGAYQARVLVRDRVNATALSSPLLITVEEGAPTGGIPWWLLALGALGVFGLFGLSKKSKRQQAQEKRQAAQKLRSQAQTARLKGNAAQATQLESQAGRLEQEATALEQQAAQEEALQRQLQQPPGR